MATLRVGKSLNDDDVLWRYLPLDGLINMLDSGTLYFSPLTAYQATDPFEGFMPKVAMDAIAGITLKGQNSLLAQVDQLEAMAGPNQAVDAIAKLRAEASSHSAQMKEMYKKIMSCLMVNCWHKSNHESEAMWGLYSKAGVAIKTSVGAIKAALEGNTQDHVINMGTIKYIDFSDRSITPPDCVTEDGHLMGMIKRIAYAHEKEVRMNITRKVDRRDWDKTVPAPTSVDIDVSRLINGLVISPFASTSMRKSIIAVAKVYGIDREKVSESPLLENCEYLLDAYTPTADEPGNLNPQATVAASCCGC